MRIRKSLLAAGSGVAVLLAVGAPAVAYAEGNESRGSTSTAASCPRQDVHKAVAAYLDAHPDVAAEVTKIRALPADQRAAARKAYLAQHSDVAAALHGLRAQAQGDWAEALAPVGAYLADHPDVADLLTQLKNASATQRKQVAESYLSAHPGTQAELRGALKALRQHARTCRTGGN